MTRLRRGIFLPRQHYEPIFFCLTKYNIAFTQSFKSFSKVMTKWLLFARSFGELIAVPLKLKENYYSIVSAKSIKQESVVLNKAHNM